MSKSKRLAGHNPRAYVGVNALTPPDFTIEQDDPTTQNSQNFNLGHIWFNESAIRFWVLAELDEYVATWIQFPGSAGAALTLTGNTGGIVFPSMGDIEVLGDLTVGFSVAGDPPNNQLSITTANGQSIGQSLTGNSGGAVFPDGAGNIDVLGDTGVGITVTGDPADMELVITSTGGDGILQTLTADSGGAVGPDGSFNINVVGGTGVSVAGNAGANSLTVNASATTPLQFDTNSGSAVPAANVINIVGSPSPIFQTFGTGNTVTINLENSTDGQVIIGGGSDAAWANITSTAGTMTITNGPNTINLESGTSESSFYAHKAGAANNVTGDGTVYHYVCETIRFNVGSDYDSGTGIYTAPANGVYLFGAQIQYGARLGGGEVFHIEIIANGTRWQGETYPTRNQVPNFYGPNIEIGAIIKILVPLNAGQTVFPTVAGFNGTKIDFLIPPTTGDTNIFYGELLYRT